MLFLSWGCPHVTCTPNAPLEDNTVHTEISPTPKKYTHTLKRTHIHMYKHKHKYTLSSRHTHQHFSLQKYTDTHTHTHTHTHTSCSFFLPCPEEASRLTISECDSQYFANKLLKSPGSSSRTDEEEEEGAFSLRGHQQQHQRSLIRFTKQQRTKRQKNFFQWGSLNRRRYMPVAILFFLLWLFV